MSEKINIAELLENCPKGMELYSPIFGKVYLDKVRPHLGVVVTTDKEQSDFKEEFLYDGRYGMNGECMIFPSKDQRDWSKFETPYKFKNGDIYYIKDVFGQEWVSIIKKCENDKLYTYVDIGISNNTFYCEASEGTCYCKDIIEHRLVTEEEKAKLFQAIKDNGYKWNEETKTLKKLPKFKVGDVIQDKGGYKVRITNVSIEDEYYGYESLTVNGIGGVSFNRQDGWELAPNKFDITTLKPFDSKVLVRHNKDNKWCASFFSHIDGDFHSHCYKYVTIAGKSYPMCIPYDGNEHLLGTTNECDEYYKNWKE